ncbi:MAG: isoprenylcysteine carboxylmethyltransferase family protein [Candidatus Omnitrophica bacterium]|nr:isoprenylcysteine carboxylmethyltransferase family protein [Candidatus Omnitrophota bacterium]
MKKRIGIQGFFVFLTIIISILLSNLLFHQREEVSLDRLFDMTGIVIILVGFLFRITARGYKSEKSNNGRTLVRDGPYRFMRHPMYFGTFLIGTGIILVLFKWWTFFLFLTVFLLIYMPQIKKEEALLTRCFGNEYLIYCKDVPKYFPDVSRFFKTDVKDGLSFKIAWVNKELPSLIGVFAIISMIETWQDMRLFGYKGCFEELITLFFIIGILLSIFLLFFKKKFNRKTS